MTKLFFEPTYKDFLSEVKLRYRSAQLKASYSVNLELIQFYWQLGKDIIDKQINAKWGSKFLDQLSTDLQSEFIGTKGFSVRNLKLMRQFAELYPNIIGQQAVAQLPWGHIAILMQKVKNPKGRDWYAQNALKNNISRDVLRIQIEQDLYGRQGLEEDKFSNFKLTLPKPQSDLAIQMLKNPYNFDFLTIGNDAHEKEVEKQLVNHISKFLVELGVGFAYMGKQYKLTVQGDNYWLDLLFFHVKLNCYVVIEIKVTDFEPEYAGKLNFYLSLVDDLLKERHHNPTIGILLCKKRKKYKAEYALRGISNPIGVSEYELIKQLPEKLKINLPTIEELEAELEKD